MHHKAGGLVYHQHISVFVYYIEGYVLSNDFKLVARAIHHHLHYIEWLYTVVALHGLAVDEYTPCLGSLLYAVARRFLETFDKEFIYTQELLPFVGNESEMLVEFVAVDLDNPFLGIIINYCL